MKKQQNLGLKIRCTICPRQTDCLLKPKNTKYENNKSRHYGARRLQFENVHYIAGVLLSADSAADYMSLQARTLNIK
jgi:hypothetical protein